MTNVREWLDSIGLSQYADAFEENEVDWTVLPHLDHDVLKDIGVRAAGHRVRILKATEALASAAAQVAPKEQEEPPVGSAAAATPGGAERRQLTVMFCDLVGSTSLTQGMDPEEYRDLLAAYQSAVRSAIEPYGGYIARYMGDGLLVYFGYPMAQENDPERGVRAGLAVTQAVTELETSVPLQTRVGIATGPVVVGDIIGEGASEEAAVLGETPNLAARLQAAAVPNTVLLSPTTQALLGGRIETAPLEPVELKGLSRPIVPYRAIRARSLPEVSEIQLDSTPLIGRDVEVALLRRAWQHAQSSEGQAVLLSGEPGVGKSRLLRAFQEELRISERTWVQWYCSAYYQTTANHPAIEQLKRTLGVDTRSDVHSLERLETMVLELGLDAGALVPALASLLSVPLDERYDAPNWSPDDHRQRLICAQVSVLLAAAKQAGVLFVVEDLHWADPTTLEVLGEIVAVIRDEPVLVLMTARPGFTLPWADQPHVITQRLTSLSRQETMALVRGIAEQHSLSREIIDQIVERTDGVPLFVEELTREVIESAGQLAVPASLQDALMARLDRLGVDKELAQIASVLGRNFSLEDVCALSDQPRKEVEGGLDNIIAAGLAHRRRSDGTEYEFKHALIRDAAYASLLHRERRALHARIARRLEQESPERVEAEPEVLAHHYTEAGILEPALKYWLIAGQRSVQRCAHPEAITDLARGLALMQTLPDSADKSRNEITFRLALGVALLGKEGAASQAVADNYLRAQALREEAGEHEQLYPITWGLWLHHFFRSELHEACALADKLLELGKDREDIAMSLEGHHCQWATRFVIGDLVPAMEHCAQGIALYRPEEHHPLTFVYGGHDPGVCARNVSAIGLWLLGYPEQSRERVDAAFTLARSLGHSATTADALQMVVELSVLQRDVDALEEQASELLELATTERAFPNMSLASGLLGWISFRRGRVDEGLSQMRESAKDWLGQGTAWTAIPISLVAETLGQIGEVEEALGLVDKVLLLGQKNEVRWWEAELYRVKGELLAKKPEGQTEAEDALSHALAVARGQNAKLLELRAAVSLARLKQRCGVADDSLNALAAVYNWFGEGFDTDDLKAARALLG